VRGGFLGSFLSNPFGLGLLGVAALGITLYIFRDKISGFFQSGFDSISSGLVNIELPDINLPDINFPNFNFPEITFPDFNIDFGDPLGDLSQGFEDLSKSFTESVDTIIEQFSNPDEAGRDVGSSEPVDTVPDTTGGLADRHRGLDEALDPDPAMEEPPLIQTFRPADFNTERTDVSFGTEIIVPLGDELDLGGGFILYWGYNNFWR